MSLNGPFDRPAKSGEHSVKEGPTALGSLIGDTGDRTSTSELVRHAVASTLNPSEKIAPIDPAQAKKTVDENGFPPGEKIVPTGVSKSDCSCNLSEKISKVDQEFFGPMVNGDRSENS